MDVEAEDAEIYRKYSDDLVRYATGLVGPDDAADVVADAVLGCFSWTALESSRCETGYLYRSVFNKALELTRSARRRRFREAFVAPPELFEHPELRPEVLAAVFGLSAKQRSVIVLTYWDDLDPSSTAQLMNISEGSVKRHLARGRSRLKEVLKNRE